MAEMTRAEWRDWSRAIEPDSPKKLSAAELWLIRAMQNTTEAQRNRMSGWGQFACTCQCPVHGRNGGSMGILSGLIGGSW